MEKFVVAVFPNEAKAYEGVSTLRELDSEGSLALYGTAVVTRDAAGKMAIRQAADQGPLGTGIGALLGGLVGVLGGPLGVAVGVTSGAMIGGIGDLYSLGVSSSFVDEVSRSLTPGAAAVIADVDEEWITPLDTRMEAVGATVFRDYRADVEDRAYEARVTAAKADLAHLKAEFAQAHQERRAKMQAHMERAQAKLRDTADRAERWFESRQEETAAKIKALEDRAKSARTRSHAAAEQRISELRDDYARRKVKLDQARELARESREVMKEAIAA